VHILIGQPKSSKALFPSNSKQSKDGFMCGNSLRRMKEIVEQDLQIRFELRECRRTFGQRYIDQNLELTSVSVLMGHASTRTTEKYYGRQKNIMAMGKARRTWSSGSDETTSENPLPPPERGVTTTSGQWANCDWWTDTEKRWTEPQKWWTSQKVDFDDLGGQRKWTVWDLNPRPPACKAGDLPADLTAQ